MSCSSPARYRSRCVRSSRSSRHGQPDGDARHPLRVPGRVRRLGVDHGRERLRHPVEPVLVERLLPVLRLPHPHPRLLERRPEQVVVLERAERVGEHRVEPRAAPRACHLAGGRGAAELPEHLRGLGQAEDPAEQRDLLAGQPRRIAAAVPVLVERGDRLRRRLVHPHVARHVGPALAAQRRQVAGAVRPVLDQRLDVACLGQRRGARRGVAQQVAQRLRRAQVVGRLAVLLDQRVGVPVQRRHLGGVRRAARVLQQQRVEQRRQVPLVEPDLGPEAHPDHAGPLRVSARLALGDVEGVRERRQDLGQAKLHTGPSTRSGALFSARSASGTARPSPGSGSCSAPRKAGPGGSYDGRPRPRPA